MVSTLCISSFAAKLALLVCLAFLLTSCSLTSAPDKQSEQKDKGTGNEILVSDANADPAEPGITADSDGNIYVVYVEHAEDKSADLFLQKFDSALRRSGGKVRINPNPGTVKAWAGDAPTIVIAPDKTIFVGWTNRTAANGTDFVLSSSRSGGTSFCEPTKINDDEAPASHGMHSLTVDKNGNIFAAWLDERNIAKAHAQTLASDVESGHGFHGVEIDHKASESSHEPEPNSEVFFASSADGGKTFSKNQRIGRDVCPCCKTSVVAGNDGRIYVSWRQVLDGDHRHIAVAASSDGGKSFSTGSIVSDDNWQIAACPVSGAAIQAGEQGENLNVAWYTAGDAGEAGYYLARLPNGGEKFGQRLLVSSDARSGTPVLLRSGSELTIVMPGSENRTLIFASDNGGSSFSAPGIIEQAGNPAAVIANGATYIAFVRNENNNRSVLIAKR